jgi:hypothetical protein
MDQREPRAGRTGSHRGRQGRQTLPRQAVKRRPGLFCGFWTDLNGRRIRRITRAELAELYRLRAKHRDVLEGRVKAA